MLCPNCNTQNKNSNRFCKKCGKPLPSPVVAAPQPPPPPLANEKKKLNPSQKAAVIFGGILVLLIAVFVISMATGILRISFAATTSTTLPPETNSPEIATLTPPLNQDQGTDGAVWLVPTLNPDAQLKDAAAWLVYVNGQKGIMAVNSDGGGPNPVFRMPLISLAAGTFDIPIGINPYAQPYLALRVERENRPGWDLVLVHLPDLVAKIIAPLISDQNLKGITSNNNVDIDLQMAILDENAIRWSPNGRYLAFAAAIDGPSSDLYVYDLETNQLTRLSTGELHVATPYWTSDSKQIFYQAVETFGRGAGWSAKSAWVVDLKTQTSRKLYDFTEVPSSVTPLGITANNFILLDTISPSHPDLRFVDLATGTVKILATGEVQVVSLNRSTGAVVFVDKSNCVNFVSKPTDTPRCVGTVSGDILSATPDDIVQGFVINTKEGIFTVDPKGTMTKIYEQPGVLTRDTPKGLFCISGDTLQCGVGWLPSELHVVTKSPSVKVIGFMFPDLFFVDGSSLYCVSSIDWNPVLIDDGLMPVNEGSEDLRYDNIGWVLTPG